MVKLQKIFLQKIHIHDLVLFQNINEHDGRVCETVIHKVSCSILTPKSGDGGSTFIWGHDSSCVCVILRNTDYDWLVGVDINETLPGNQKRTIERAVITLVAQNRLLDHQPTNHHIKFYVS